MAFEQLGGAERSLELARDYALQRYAFGRLIGSFQAIKHKRVDMYVKNDARARPCLLRRLGALHERGRVTARRGGSTRCGHGRVL